MRSNYKRIGDYIKQRKVKNTEGHYSKLLGINIDKFFMPSVANVIGTDLTRYKVVKHNQFACNRMHVGRDYRIPIALSKSEEPFIVSPAYTVFEIKDTSVLDPDYLMMWFSRSEFDRETWFHTDADVRGGLPWDLFCDTELPIPSIEKQQEIVAEYNTIANRIALNEQLNLKLEETAQTLYKHWFVDFEFPNENGEPYKSSGGEMVYNEELDREIPVGWEPVDLGSKINHKKGKAFKSNMYTDEGVPIIRVSDLTMKSVDFSNCLFIPINKLDEFKDVEVKENDIIITSVGSWASNPNSVVGKVVKFPRSNNFSLLNQNMVRLRTKNTKSQLIIYTSLSRKEFSEYVISGAQGSANQASVTLDHLFDYKLCLPPEEELNLLSSEFNSLYCRSSWSESEINILKGLKDLLLSKMSRLEVENEIVN